MTPERKVIAPPVFLVGEQNPHGDGDRYALYPLPENSAGGRLCTRVLGVSRFQYIRSFRRKNLLGPGKWNAPAAAVSACWLIDSFRGARYVLLGAKVSAAFLADSLSNFEEGIHVDGSRLLRLPHPSGRCRVWGEPGAYEKARAALRAFLPPEIAVLVGGADARA